MAQKAKDHWKDTKEFAKLLLVPIMHQMTYVQRRMKTHYHIQEESLRQLQNQLEQLQRSVADTVAEDPLDPEEKGPRTPDEPVEEPVKIVQGEAQKDDNNAGVDSGVAASTSAADESDRNPSPCIPECDLEDIQSQFDQMPIHTPRLSPEMPPLEDDLAVLASMASTQPISKRIKINAGFPPLVPDEHPPFLPASLSNASSPEDWMRGRLPQGYVASPHDLYELGCQQPRLIVRSFNHEREEIKSGRVRAAIAALCNVPARAVLGPWLCEPPVNPYETAQLEPRKEFLKAASGPPFDMKFYWQVPVYFDIMTTMVRSGVPGDPTAWFCHVKFHQELALRNAVSKCGMAQVPGHPLGFVNLNYMQQLKFPHPGRVYLAMPRFTDNILGKDATAPYSPFLKDYDMHRVDQTRGFRGLSYT